MKRIRKTHRECKILGRIAPNQKMLYHRHTLLQQVMHIDVSMHCKMQGSPTINRLYSSYRTTAVAHIGIYGQTILYCVYCPAIQLLSALIQNPYICLSHRHLAMWCAIYRIRYKYYGITVRWNV